MTIFGALVSILGSVGYATYDEARSWYRIANYKMPQSQAIDRKLYYDLKATFDDNWTYEGASLYPSKLIPFLALNERIRELWVNSIVMQILNMHNKTSGGLCKNNSPRLSSIPYGCGASQYNGKDKAIDSDEIIYGPSYYEYDFVKKNYPDDWNVYVNGLEQKDKEEKEQAHTTAIRDYVLIGLSAALIIGIIVLFGFFVELFAGWNSIVFGIVLTMALIAACVPGCFVMYKHGVKPPRVLLIAIAIIVCVVCFAYLH